MMKALAEWKVVGAVLCNLDTFLLGFGRIVERIGSVLCCFVLCTARVHIYL
jgi:hypothetical protein